MRKGNIKGIIASICIMVVMIISITINTAQDNTIKYELQENKQSAVIHIDVNKVIGNNELIAVKDEEEKTLTNYDIVVNENKEYTYTVIYKVNSEIKTEKLSILVSGIEIKETEARYFEFDSSTGTITRFKKEETPTITEVIIPSQIDGVDVVALGLELFAECDTLTYVKMPNTILEVDESIFYNCEKLKKVDLSNNIRLISAYMFMNCKSLENIVLPEELTGIGYHSFLRCTSLKSVILPDSVTVLGPNGFAICSSLKSINMPKELNEIYESVFDGCSLSQVNFSDIGNITSIDSSAFHNQKPVLNYYKTSDGNQYLNLNEYIDNLDKMTITAGDFIDLGNGIYKANNENIQSISYELELIDAFPNAKLTARATFNNINVYKVNYECEGQVLKEEYIEEGKKIEFPKIPEKEGYIGIWDKTDDVINSDTTYNVVYKKNPVLNNSNQKTIQPGEQINLNELFTFQDADGNLIEDVVFEGKIDVHKRGVYTLRYTATDKWGGQTKGTCAVYVSGYEYQFVCGDEIIKEGFVAEGTKVEFPKIPVKKGYTGIWDKNNDIITDDIVYNVVYKALPITDSSAIVQIEEGEEFNPYQMIMFKDADGNRIKNVVFMGEVKTDNPGEYVLKYEATDQWGGKLVGEYVIVIMEKEKTSKPIIQPETEKEKIEFVNKEKNSDEVITNDKVNINFYMIIAIMSSLCAGMCLYRRNIQNN